MFMASGILLQYSEYGVPREQTVAHDLESFIYVFIYICVMYDGPGDKLRNDKLFNDTIIGRWIYGPWDVIGLIKQRHLERPDLIIADITQYFQPFSTLVTKLCSLLSEQVNYVKMFDDRGVKPTIKPPLTHSKIINIIQPAIDDDEPLSIHTRIRRLVFDGKAPSFVMEGDRPFVAPKVKRGGDILNDQRSAKRQRTTSGVKPSRAIRATRASENSSKQGRRHRSGRAS